MSTLEIEFEGGVLPTYVAKPAGEGPWPAVVVIHDAIGMSHDLENQADWLAEAGYLAAAPDLFEGGTFLGCIRTIIRDFSRGEGILFDRVEAVRSWLETHPESTGKVGVIGFCFGGGFALMLAPRGKYAAASVNYGSLPNNAEDYLKTACPIVGSYGAKDRTLRGAAGQLGHILAEAGVEHDIKEYPQADHAFMNDHAEDKIPFLIRMIAYFFGGGEPHAESAADARRRIIAFFGTHLRD